MKYFRIIFLILPSVIAYSQSEYVVSGKIVDEQNNPVPYANVAVYSNDSTFIGGSVSDETGIFSAKVKSGMYYLKITFLSFDEKVITDINIDKAGRDLGKIVLMASAKLLKEVEVRGEKTPMELQLDKRVFNVEKDLSNIGGSAADILSNIPSVQVDVDGSVSLRGSGNVRILINGKPSGLTSRNPDALRYLQGNLIERIEVITNPSSRYDAAGEVGIINIVLKKNQSSGFNGVFTVNAGYPDYYGGAYSINLRRKKVNLFSSYGMNYRKNSGYGKSYQHFSDSDTTFTYSQYTDRSFSELSHNLTAGIDYFINEKNSITGSIMYNISDGLNKSFVTYNDIEYASTTSRSDREVEDEFNIEGALNYKKEFKERGHELTADFQYIENEDAEESDYTQTTGSDVIYQHAKNDAREKNWLIQSDYIRPFSKDGKFEAGLKSTTRIIDNDYALTQQNEEGEWIEFPAFNNNMIYTERIHAAYVMAGNKFNAFSLQTGLRAEYSDIKTELTETDEVNHREYFNLFPSANLGYAIKENRTLQLSYSYRINRPEFRDLLPFSDFTDTRVFFVGNPNLNPEYTHAFEGGYLMEWASGTFLSSAYYRYRKGVIQRINEVEDGITRIIPINMSSENTYGLELNFSLTIQKWWQLNSTANFYRSITEGSYEDEELYSDNYSMNTRTTSKMTFFKSLDFQVAFNYQAPRITTQGKIKSIYSIDLAFTKDVFKGRGTLAFNVRDLLNSRKRRAIIDIDNYYSESEWQRRPRQFMLTFSYRINRDKEREKRTGGNGEGEEF